MRSAQASPVKLFAGTMSQEPPLKEGVWMTPMIVGVCGIAAALCALVFA